MDVRIMARSLPSEKCKRLCDLNAPGHNKIIMPGQSAIQIVQGEAQGMYHNRICYETALRQYKDIKKQVLGE